MPGPSNTSNTHNLLIEVRRVYSAAGDIQDMPALDAINCVTQFPAQWSYTPFAGQPTDLVRPNPTGPLVVRF